MRRIPIGWSVSAAALGCVLILFAGGPEKGIQGWEPLNDQLEQAIAANHPEGKATAAGGAGTRTEASPGKAGSGGQTLEAKAATEGAPVVAAQSSKSEAPAGKAAPPQADADLAPPPAEASSGEAQAGLNPVTAVTPAEASSGEAQAGLNPVTAVTPAEAAPPTASPSSQPATGVSSGLINVNTADAAGLMELPGIGQAKAKAIIDYRNQHGAFRSVADLMNVKGIGPKMLEKMKPYVEL